jgi:uncharacterized membrane protein (UPF0136 family)
MKKLSILIIALLATVYGMSQAPPAFAFQSTIMDTLGNPLENRAVSVQYDIHSGSNSGPVVYTETHSVTTSVGGYFTANVGQGSVVSGTFAGINWGTSTYYLELSVDTTGGSTYISLGASQLLSVPYALNAGSSNNTPPSYFYGAADTGVYHNGNDSLIIFNATIIRGLTHDTLTGIFTVTSPGIYEIFIRNSTGITTGYINGVGIIIPTNTNIVFPIEFNIGDTFYVRSTYQVPYTRLIIKEIK